VYRADRWGRRRALTITIAGYRLFSFLTALSPNVWAFAFFQLCARIFLLGEYAVAMVYGAALIFTIGAVSVLAAYTLTSQWALTVALVLGIFSTGATLLVLNAFTAELFPTELRSEAYAWSNNLLARSVYLVSPLAVGLAAETYGWGPAVAATAIFPLLALGLIWAVLPETAGRELEETSAV
jgi:MFS transporter, putative metabolite:H+ symporter